MLRTVLGWVCVAIGIVAILTPFTPGGWFLFIGLELLGLRLLWRRRKALPEPVPAIPMPEVRTKDGRRVVP